MNAEHDVVPVTVVIATRNRVSELCRTLGKLTALEERPEVIVVDNGSADGTAAAVREGYPSVTLIRMDRNQGAWARNVGVARAATRYVAFSDDDSWWEPGSLRLACELLDAHAGLGMVTARTLVGEQAAGAAAPPAPAAAAAAAAAADPGNAADGAAGAEDPLNAVLAASPLPRRGLPGPRVLGFLGCASVARRAAFLRAGGYSRLLGVGGEEALLAMDLAAAGWAVAYVDALVARHVPSPSRDLAARLAREERNRVLVSWLRRPAGRALAGTALLAARAGRDPVARRALAGLLAALPRALAARRRLPPAVEADLRMLERSDGG